MHDSDEVDEPYFAEMCDISDVTITMPPNRKRNRVVLVIESETDFNLMKFYLSLKSYVEKIETEIGIMVETGDMQ